MTCKKTKTEDLIIFGIAATSLIITITSWVCTINQPLLDLFSFRQCQTAMTSLWMDLGGGWNSVWNYITPEFGEPWSIPFEFPFYQFLVKLTSAFLHTAIDPTGRILSCIFFLGAIFLGMRLIRQIGLPREVVLCFFIFSICSPFYIYWSRTFMIESCSVFFGLLMLVSIKEYLIKINHLWLALAILASLLCALVKVTTYPSFALVAFFLIYFTPFDGLGKKNIYKNIVFLSLLIAVPIVIIWTHHCDSIKDSNELTKYLTSNNLGVWNYGTFAQRCSRKLWVDVIFGRAIPHILGSIWVCSLIVGGLLFSKTRIRIYILVLIVAFITPFLLFTNLHIIHTYYQYANGLWLLMALAISVYGISRRLPLPTFTIIITAIVCIELCAFYRFYWSEMLNLHNKDDVITAAGAIKKSTSSTSSILIIGDDWSPELGYYSNRRSVYYPDWLTFEQARLAFSKKSLLSGKYPLSAVVIRRNSPSGNKNSESWSFIREWSEEHARKEIHGDYDIYFIRNES